MKLFEKLKSLGGQPWHILSEELLNSLITEAEFIEIKAKAFDRIQKYCTWELWNQMLEEARKEKAGEKQ